MLGIITFAEKLGMKRILFAIIGTLLISASALAQVPETIETSLPVPEAIDLGLSVKWASFNVGASRPEEYGNYYSWGEVEVKDEYSIANYKWCKPYTFKALKKYSTASGNGVLDNKSILEADDDVACKEYGSQWRMPTKDEFQELTDNCECLWTERGGVNGMLFTSKINGNSVFFPAAGFKRDDRLNKDGFVGHYWSASLSENQMDNACSLDFHKGRHIVSRTIMRLNGMTVRAVMP